MPYESDDEAKAGREGEEMLSEEEEGKEEEEEGEGGRHKYNYFSGVSPLFNLVSLPGALMLASNFVFLFLSMQSMQ